MERRRAEGRRERTRSGVARPRQPGPRRNTTAGAGSWNAVGAGREGRYLIVQAVRGGQVGSEGHRQAGESCRLCSHGSDLLAWTGILHVPPIPGQNQMSGSSGCQRSAAHRIDPLMPARHVRRALPCWAQVGTNTFFVSLIGKFRCPNFATSRANFAKVSLETFDFSLVP